MEEERIKVVKTWSEPQSVRDIQVFLSFANFYRRFIQGFSKIAAPLTSMLRTTLESLSPTSTNVREPEANSPDGGEVIGGDGGEIFGGGRTENLSKAKNSKNLAKSKKPDSMVADLLI